MKFYKNFAFIDKRTGEKFYMNNETKRLMYVNLMEGPHEKNPKYYSMKKVISEEALKEYIKESKVKRKKMFSRK